MRTARTKPSKIVLFFGYIFAWPYYKHHYNITVKNREVAKEIKPPFVVIGNHGTSDDPMLVQGAVYPHKITYVGSYANFYNRRLRWLMKAIRVIPKFQYQLDYKAMKQMLQVVKDGGVLGLFPTGRMPSCGAGFEVTDSVAKLLKKCNVPVLFAKIDGTALSAPKWAKHHRKGKVDVTLSLLCNGDEIKSITIDALTKKLNEVLMFNDYEWNREQRVEFKGKRLAENLETTLYRCPKCGKEFEMQSCDDVLECQSCHFKVKVNPDGFFEDNPYYDHPNEWYEAQRESVDKLIEKDGLLIEDKVVVKSPVGKKIVKIGDGVLTLDKDNFTFKGTIDQKETTMIFPTKDMYSLPYKAGANIELADNNHIYQFWLDKGIMATKWSLVVEELYKTSQKTQKRL